MENNTIISLQNIDASFGKENVLKSFNLNIRDGELVTLLGPSGYGKTTTLRIIGGFVTPDTGDVFFNGKKINNLPPHKREVNTIFQKHALFPYLNVFENVAFGMRVYKRPEAQVRETVGRMLEMVNLGGFARRSVNSLSDGQQQRVAIARVLANEPKVLLLDEPLDALGLRLRRDIQTELKKIQQQLGITLVSITHNQEEALPMSDTVVVVDKGRIQQIGMPQDIYNEPQNTFIAGFIGESNIIDGVMHRDFLVEFAGRRFGCLNKGLRLMEPVDVVIRPENIEVVSPVVGHISGMVTSVNFKGVHYEITVDVQDFKWMIQSTESQEIGNEIGLILQSDDIHVMKKSEYSGMLGDYSTFSDEMEEGSQPPEEGKEAES